MRRNDKAILSILILALSASSLFAGLSTSPSIGLSIAGNLCIPTAEYLKEYPGDPDVRMPVARTSMALLADVCLLNAKHSLRGGDSAMYLGAGFSLLNVSRSMRFGSSLLKPYVGFGLLVELGYDMDETYSLALKYRLYNCSFTGSKAHFLAWDAELCGYWRLWRFSAFDAALSVPLTISFKVDSVTVRTGVGVSISIDSNRLPSVRKIS